MVLFFIGAVLGVVYAIKVLQKAGFVLIILPIVMPGQFFHYHLDQYLTGPVSQLFHYTLWGFLAGYMASLMVYIIILGVHKLFRSLDPLKKYLEYYSA
jgi:hypothetical protein